MGDMMPKMPIRILIGKGGLDGHDRGVKYIVNILRDAGFEVIYPGIRRSPEQIVDVAIKNDVALIGLSFLSGAHIPVFTRMVELLKAQGAEDIILVCGGIIPPDDIMTLKSLGIAAVFTPGTPDVDIVKAIKKLLGCHDQRP